MTHTLGIRFLFAFVVAVGLWVWRTETTIGVQPVTVPSPVTVEITGVSQGLIVVPQPNQNGPQTVTVQASVPANDTDSVSTTWFRATIDVSDQKGPGTRLFPVNVESLKPGVSPIKAIPPSLPVTLDVIGKRTMSSQPVFQGNVPTGYVYSTTPVLDNSASSVTITGPESVLQQIASVIYIVRLDNRKATFHDVVNLVPQNALGGDVPTDDLQLSPKTVGFTETVGQQTSTRAVAVVPKMTGQPAEGYVVAGIAVSPAQVTLVGNPSVLDSLPASLSTDQVDVSNATGDVTKTVAVLAPKDTSVVGDAKVQVTVQIRPIPSSALLAVAPTIEGAAPGTRVDLSVNSINVTLQGAAPTLKQVQPKDIGIAVNVAGLGPGQHEVTPTINLPAGVTVQSITPAKVQVTIVPPTPTPTPTRMPTPTATATPPPTSTPAATPTASRPSTAAVPAGRTVGRPAA